MGSKTVLTVIIILLILIPGVGQEGPTSRRFQGNNFRAKAAPRPGIVTDANGAAIPNAKVTITNEKTGFTRTVTTDEDGTYSLVGLPPGTYKIEVDAPGFDKTEIQGVVVLPGEISAPGVQLSAGGVSGSVAVTAVAPAIN
ncbi:MAG TPA: carboxypeptidase-like regulatory domain-containing protein, partial [Blastocatellia bacterium]|nr:carboxypeptidase-like regulatory domain-containing protein [Blastocatellia bacterium]